MLDPLQEILRFAQDDEVFNSIPPSFAFCNVLEG